MSSYSLPKDIGMKEAVSKMHLEAKKVITKLKREIKRLKEENNTLKQNVRTILENIKEPVETLCHLLDIHYEKPETTKHRYIRRIRELEEEIKKLRASHLTVEEHYQNALDLLKHPSVQKEIRRVMDTLSYSEKWVWDILSILIDKKEATINSVSRLITDIKRGSVAAIMGRLNQENIFKKHQKSYKHYYSINEEHLKALINRELKKKEIQKLKKTFNGGN